MTRPKPAESFDLFPKAPKTFLISFHRALNAHELHIHSRQERAFSDALVMGKVYADFELTLLSFDGKNFTAAALFTSGNRPVTSTRRAKFEHIHQLPEPLPVRLVLGRTKVQMGAIDATRRLEPTTVEGETAGGSIHGLARVRPET